ncbi:hypothetical protein WR25_27242 [Diploscapter pachys]|uniref:C3H1-type domain-containing protein n=1 Tax=Diploscapter pachys TaxID=2018661 RepID=A0A2A2LDF0_9BILA|nr:hypothetical protein WR25_27242 [Diploscapter pachys]
MRPASSASSDSGIGTLSGSGLAHGNGQNSGHSKEAKGVNCVIGPISGPPSPTQMDLLREAAMISLLNSQFSKKLEAYNANGGSLMMPLNDLPLSSDALLSTAVSRSLASVLAPNGINQHQPTPLQPHNQAKFGPVRSGNAPSSVTSPQTVDSFKTVMCKAWLEGYPCPFQENCKFAHGEHELREIKSQPRQNQKYRTKLCDKYTKQGVCPYGERCLFIHPNSGPNAYIRPDKMAEIGERRICMQQLNSSSSQSVHSGSTLSLCSLIEGTNIHKGAQTQTQAPSTFLPLSRSSSPLSQMEKSACLNWTGLDSGMGSSPLSDAGLPPLTSSLLGAKKHGSSSALPDLLSLPLAPTPNRFTNARDKDGQHNMKGEKFSGYPPRAQLRPHPSWPLEPSSFFSTFPFGGTSPGIGKANSNKHNSTSSPVDDKKCPPLPEFFKGMLPCDSRITPPRLQEISSELAGFSSPLAIGVDSPFSTHSTDGYDFSHLIADVSRFDSA